MFSTGEKLAGFVEHEVLQPQRRLRHALRVPLGFVAVMATLNVPVCVVEPLMAPVLVLNVSPAGNVDALPSGRFTSANEVLPAPKFGV